MPKISFITPLDQPTGNRRLLNLLKACLRDRDYSSFRCAVAFTKSGPLLRLKPELVDFRLRGGTSLLVSGIDHLGTSWQGLNLVLQEFTSAYVTNYPRSTFHPKIFLFLGEKKAIAYIGSNNLTVGGTETNFETSVCIEYHLPADQADLNQAIGLIDSLLPEKCAATRILDNDYLIELNAQNLLLDETRAGRRREGTPNPRQLNGRNNSIVWAPPSPIPTGVIPDLDQPAAQEDTAPANQDRPAVLPQALVIQIAPHKNGEIFLSTTASAQHPQFFGIPFTGHTAPKKIGNPSYPQRYPDPIVDINVIGEQGRILLTMPDYALNMVLYERNSEIRITAAPLVQVVPDYSIMVMKNGVNGIDYSLEIHTPASPGYEAFLTACNQSMPSGGRRVARRFGWI